MEKNELQQHPEEAEHQKENVFCENLMDKPI